MRLRPRPRKLVLAVHLGVSIGWIGAVGAYVPFDVVAATSADAAQLRGAYLAMDLIARVVIVPFAIAALSSGILISIGTAWGLVRHWWVLISFLLTTVASLVLLVETRAIAAMAAVAADPASSIAEVQALGNTLLHSVGGMVVLLFVLVLNVFKPRGQTVYGWRKQREERTARRAGGDRPAHRLPS